MTDRAPDKFTAPSEVVVVRPGEPEPENVIERAKRILRERLVAGERDTATR